MKVRQKPVVIDWKKHRNKGKVKHKFFRKCSSLRGPSAVEATVDAPSRSPGRRVRPKFRRSMPSISREGGQKPPLSGPTWRRARRPIPKRARRPIPKGQTRFFLWKKGHPNVLFSVFDFQGEPLPKRRYPLGFNPN